MTEKKYCERCGKLIGDAYETDFFAYIRMKYCDECKVQVRRKNYSSCSCKHFLARIKFNYVNSKRLHKEN